MPLKPIGSPSKAVTIALLVSVIVGLASSLVAWGQYERERQFDEDDLNRRSRILAQQLSPYIVKALSFPDAEANLTLKDDLEGHSRLLGYSVFRPNGRLLAAGKGVSDLPDPMRRLAGESIDTRQESTAIERDGENALHLLAHPIRDADGSLQGVLVVVHDASHLEQRSSARSVRLALWVVGSSLLLFILVVIATWLVYDRPLKNLATWMQRLRAGEETESPPGLPVALLASESDRLAASFRAARAASGQESRDTLREHGAWTRDRLRATAIDSLDGGPLVVVSNREPYMHQFKDGKPVVIKPAGGLVTALDPVLQACGGVWVAHGAGDADRPTADAAGRLMVPPANPRYTLRRIWLTREEEQGYYYGFANEGLWPLCHLAHERPQFRADEWEEYVRVNRRFADAVLEEVGGADATVLVQDYQLALVPQMLKSRRPRLRVGIFWHIPWPSAETFRICPWRAEILKGMLGADLIGFHLQQYGNNFLDTVDRMVEARLDWDHFAVELQGHRAHVRPFPISIDSWADRGLPDGDEAEALSRRLREQHALGETRIVVGVERIDYTKGLAERFRAFARYLERCPEAHGQVTFVVLGAPSRTHIRRYRDLIAELESMADEINWRFRKDGWTPLRFLVGHHDAATVHAFMRMSTACVVSPLHDGMNLVAKEYVAAREDGDGVLVLSEFAGAARELTDAVIINPYDTEQFAEAIRRALEMPEADRRRRMEKMRRQVGEYNINRWAAKFLVSLTNVRADRPAAEPATLSAS